MPFSRKMTYEPNWLLNYFKTFTITRWIFFVAFFFFLTAFGFFVQNFVENALINSGKNTPWTVLDKFTWQSNLLLLIFSFVFVFMPNNNWVKTDTFLICTLTYIFFTFFGYNFILTFLNDGYKGDTFYDVFVSVWTHLICPLLFIGCGIAKFFLEPSQIKLRKFNRILILGMIYPTIYVIYLATIPFVLNIGADQTYSIYGVATNTKDNPAIAWPIISAMYILFFPGSFAIFFYTARTIRNKRSR